MLDGEGVVGDVVWEVGVVLVGVDLEVLVFAALVCARKDSRPLLKAKEPRGRAESESRRRAWRLVVVVIVIVIQFESIVVLWPLGFGMVESGSCW